MFQFVAYEILRIDPEMKPLGADCVAGSVVVENSWHFSQDLDWRSA